MKYISAKEAAAKWGVSSRHVQRFLQAGRVPGAQKLGHVWLIPDDAKKPIRLCGAKQLPQNAPLPYLPYVFISSVLPFSPDNPDAALHTLPNQAMRAQYAAELAYLRGDFGAILPYALAVSPDAPTYLCACASAMVTAINTGDYPAYTDAAARLTRVKNSTDSRDAALFADAALATPMVSMFTPEMSPEWLRKGDFSAFPGDGKPWMMYLYSKYLQSIRQHAAQLAVAQTTLTLCATPQGYTLLDIYLRLMCASACHAMDDRENTRRWLSEALAIGLPNGFITPFAETIMTYGGMLEQCLLADWPEYYAGIVKQPESVWKHWISFHNQFAKDNITLLLNLQEYRLAQHLANGMTYAEAARQMHLSVGRIKNLVSSIYGKLFIDNRKDLQRFIL